MKLIIGEPGPGFVVEPGYYPNNSVHLPPQWSSEENVSNMIPSEYDAIYFSLHFNLCRSSCIILLPIHTSPKTWSMSSGQWWQRCASG